MGELRRLKEEDLLAYDFRPEVYSSLENTYRGAIAANMLASMREVFGSDRFLFLDVGGGSGVLSDYLLERFPRAQGVLIDTSTELLARNRPDERKRTLLLSAEDMGTRLTSHSFDLVCCHCILHHIVDGRYRSSGDRVRNILTAIRTLMKPTGYLSVLEHCYDGHLIDSLPSWLIFQATSARALSRLCSRMGAHTAGVGVRFLSQERWRSTLAECGFNLERCDVNPPKPLSWFIRRALCIRSAHVAHFWCRPRDIAST